MTRFVSPTTDSVVEVVAVVVVDRATFLLNRDVVDVVIVQLQVETISLAREQMRAIVKRSFQAQMVILSKISHASDAILQGITETCAHTYQEQE